MTMTQPSQRHLRGRTSVTYAESSSDSDGSPVLQLHSRKRRARTTRGKGGSSKVARRTVLEKDLPQVEPMTNNLFQALLEDSDALASTSLTWIALFQSDESEAMTQLINFVLKCSGCETPLKRHDIEIPESADTSVKEIEEEAKKYMTQNYPLSNLEKNFRHLNKNFDMFVKSIILHAAESELLYSEDFLSNILIWISSMSVSPLMPFRHVSTCFLINVLMTLCNEFVDRSNSIATLENDLSKANKKKRGTSAKTKEQTKQEIDTQKKRKNQLEILIDETTNLVACRARDASPKVREEVISSMDDWLQETPELFLNSAKKHETFQILINALKDSSPAVRRAGVDALLNLYSNEDITVHLRQVSEPLASRLKNLIKFDADARVRRDTVKLISKLATLGHLDSNDIQQLRTYVFDKDSSVRCEAGAFFSVQAASEARDEVYSLADDFCLSHQSWAYFCMLAKQLEMTNNVTQQFETTQAEKSGFSLVSTIVHRYFGEMPTSRLIIASSAMASSSPYEWTALAEMLLFDFSSIEATEQQLAICSSERRLGILLDILCGFLQESIHSHSKLSSNKQTELYKSLTAYLPRLFDKFMKISDETAMGLVRLWAMIDLDVYNSFAESHEELVEMFKAICESFSITQSVDLIEGIQLAFASGMKCSSTRNELLDITQVITFSTFLELDEQLGDLKGADALDGRQLRLLLERTDALVSVLNASQELSNSNGGDLSVLSKLKKLFEWIYLGEALPDSQYEEKLAVVASILSILKNWSLWRLANIVDDSSDVTSDETGAEVVNHLVDYLVRFSKQNDVIHQALVETTVLQIALAVKQAAMVLESDKKVLPQAFQTVFNESMSKTSFALFLHLEALHYQSTTQKSENAPSLKSNDVDLELYADIYDGEENEGQVALLDDSDLVDFLICKYGSILSLASSVKLIPEQYGLRLKLNEKHISAEYMKALRQIRII